jgi:hypothetical protein
MEKFNELYTILDSMKSDLEKFFEKKQNVAGTRIRKELNNLRKKAAEFRKEIQEMKAARKNEGK